MHSRPGLWRRRRQCLNEPLGKVGQWRAVMAMLNGRRPPQDVTTITAGIETESKFCLSVAESGPVLEEQM